MNTIIKRLNENGYEAYLVGGFVRDLVLKRENNDIDIVTSAPIELMSDLFNDLHVIETGLKHGTILIIENSVHYELTTFRGQFNSLKDDLIKRDFTMNSLILSQDKIIDHVGGIEDIENRIIRANGNPFDRFKEDPLRILRALRFKSNLGFDIHPHTKDAMIKLKVLLKDVASERIYNEIKLLLLGDFAGETIIEYVEVLSVIIEELAKMNGFNQNNPYHMYDLLEHTCKVIDESPKDSTTRFSALFHDFGKLDTYTVDENGVGHFYRHELYSEKRAKKVLKRLKANRETILNVSTLVLNHDREIAHTKKSVKRVLMKMNYEQFYRLIDLKRADNLAHNPQFQKKESYFRGLLKLVEEIKEADEALSIKDLKITGTDLITLGYKPGPLIGNLLKEILELVVNEELLNEKDALLTYVKNIEK